MSKTISGTLGMVLLSIFLRIVYITRKEINKIFTYTMLYFHHMSNILRTCVCLLS
jgi:hypothetical protein